MKLKKSTGKTMLVLSGNAVFLYLVNFLFVGTTVLTDGLLVIAAALVLGGVFVYGTGETDGKTNV